MLETENFTIYDIDEARFKGIYGSDFNTNIAMNCEMANIWHRQGMSTNDVAINYFKGGFQSFNRLSEVITSCGKGLHKLNSFLDFASGYGRTTRFFLQKMDSSRITVSDISKEAVKYQQETFGVDGFASCLIPEDLFVDKRFEVIVVNSLFSHLNYDQWSRWLIKLYELLDTNGHLIFSTHGYSRFKNRKEALRKEMLINAPEKGFMFTAKNETRGRLDANIYGITYVLKEWVQKTVEDNNLGQYVNSFHPMHGFMGGQDIYVIKKV